MVAVVANNQFKSHIIIVVTGTKVRVELTDLLFASNTANSAKLCVPISLFNKASQPVRINTAP